jgi:N6-adenosine-specific RNA methylase IME4
MESLAGEIRLRAERRAGELLANMAEKGERQRQGGDRKSKLAQYTLIPDLPRLGVTKLQASTWQRIAAVPEQEFEARLQRQRETSKPIYAEQIVRELTRQDRRQDLAERNWPEGRYPILYADPPWAYRNSGFEQAAEGQYPTMTTDAIVALADEVEQHIADPAILFLWVTSPLLPDGLRVLEAWGFSYKTSMVWIKDRAPGMGWFVNGLHEFILIGTTGSIHPGLKVDSVIVAPVSRHSEKPDAAYVAIETMFPQIKRRIELFSRRPRLGWDSWGNVDVK